VVLTELGERILPRSRSLVADASALACTTPSIKRSHPQAFVFHSCFCGISDFLPSPYQYYFVYNLSRVQHDRRVPPSLRQLYPGIRLRALEAL